MTTTERKLAYHISMKGMGINILLFAVKGMAGLLIQSVSLLSDAVHSLTDVFSTVVVLIGIKITAKPADQGHPYGHEKIECMIAFFLGLMLFGIGGAIGWESVVRLQNLRPASAFSALNALAAAAAILSIALKEWMYRFTIRCAYQIHSLSMAADAWHHRSAAISSVGSLAGVAGIALGAPLLDVMACLAISAMIFKAAYDICSDAWKRIIDASADGQLVKAIESSILENEDVLSLDVIKTRQFGAKVYVDIEVTLDHTMSFEHSHQVAHSLHDTVEAAFSDIKHCTVHVNPSS